MENRTTYLTLSERLSQVWLNQWTVLLVLILVKLVLFSTSLKSSLETAAIHVKTACSSAEISASTLASFPHYVARASNVVIAKSLQEADRGISKGMELLVESMGQLLVFTFDLFLGTYVCLLTAAVDGSVDVAVNATEAIIDVANTTVVAFADEIQDALDGVETLVNKVINAAEKVESFFTGDDDSGMSSGFNNVSLTISSLRKWQIPASVNSKLTELQSNVPTFETVQNRTHELITFPFDKLQTAMELKENKTVSSKSMSVPGLQDVSFCSDSGIDKFFDNAYKVIHVWTIVMATLLALAAMSMMIIQGWREYKNWMRMNETARMVGQIQGDEKQALGIIDDTQHRIVGIVADWLASKSSDPVKKVEIKWLVNYTATKTALLVLLLGITGVLTVSLQFILWHCVCRNHSAITAALQKTTATVSSDAHESVKLWVDDTNDYISYQQDKINDDLLGWINTSTSTVNSTIAEFLENMDSEIDKAFEGTPLYSPIKTVIGCTIESKLLKIEKGLTWVNKHASVSFPQLSASTIWDEINTNSSSSYDSEFKNSVVAVVDAVIAEYRSALMTELYISLALVIAWLLHLIIGVVCIVWRSYQYPDTSSLASKVSYPQPLSTPQRAQLGYPEWRITGDFQNETCSFSDNYAVDSKDTVY